MAIKITMEFPNIDAAIVALGRLTTTGANPRHLPPSTVQLAATPAVAQAPFTAVAKKPRKGRSDAGKPRKKVEGAGEQTVPRSADAPAAAPAPAAAEAATQAGAQATPAGAPPSVADAQAALERLFETAPPTGGLEGARAVLSRFGVTRVRDISEDQRAEFVALVEKVLAGGAA